MKKIKLIIFLLFFIVFLSGCVKNDVAQPQLNPESNNYSSQQISECENAKGVISIIKECDGSESEWCKISEKEQCYSDQVKNGKCTIGKYDEELGGIVGVTPRVLCDNGTNENSTISDELCAKEGESIGTCAGCIAKCCSGLRPMSNLKYNGECIDLPAPGSGVTCSNCGNGTCDKQNNEDECNCPEDCK